MTGPQQRIAAAGGLVPGDAGDAGDAVEWIREHLQGGFELTRQQMALIGAVMETGMRGLSMSTPRRTGSGPLHALHAQMSLLNDLEDDVADPDPDDDDEDEDEESDDDIGIADDDGDLLARIDELTGNMCVCGCGRRIKPNGASTDFARPSCQRKWHRQHVDNAQDVYQRRDAARPYARNDVLPVPLQEANGTFTADQPAAAPVPAQIQDRPAGCGPRLPSCPDPYGAAYRRRCPQCATHVIPDVYAGDDVHVYVWGEPEPARTIPGTRHLCPDCRNYLPDPAYIAEVTDDGDRLTLQLRDDSSRTHQVITLARLNNSPDPQALIRDTWAHLEIQLGQFRRAWLGTRTNR